MMILFHAIDMDADNTAVLYLTGQSGIPSAFLSLRPGRVFSPISSMKCRINVEITKANSPYG